MADLQLPTSLLSRLEASQPMMALTGAGVSAESGLATFRGPGGLWEGKDPMELASPDAFRSEPETVLRFYAWRRSQAAAASPNPAHLALAALERLWTDFHLITQNVDGLHERCGSRRVLRLHGTLWRLRCSTEGKEFDDRQTDLETLPRCECGALLRPGVVWFGEPLPLDVLSQAERIARSARIVLVAGTSSMVYPAAALPRIAQDAGAFIVEINPDPTPLSPYVDERLAGPAGEVLPLIAAAAGAPL